MNYGALFFLNGCILLSLLICSCKHQGSVYYKNIDTTGIEQNAIMSFYELGQQNFKMYCTSCHAISREIVGPPLKETTSKYSMEWIIAFTKNSSRLIKEKDKAALKIYNEYKQAEMPRFENLSDSTIMAIFYYINSPVKSPVP